MEQCLIPANCSTDGFREIQQPSVAVLVLLLYHERQVTFGQPILDGMGQFVLSLVGLSRQRFGRLDIIIGQGFGVHGQHLAQLAGRLL